MNQFRLLGKRRFAPFFAVQSLAAFNDNAFRNATIVLVGFQLGLSTSQIGFYSNLAPALFILPFFLFSASAGQLAEKYEKHTLIRWVKMFEIAAMCVAAWGFHARSPALLFVVLFLMGLHSTVFGPIKYAILPQVLRREELVGGNGLVETGTSMAILVGMIAGGTAMASHFGWVAAAALVIAVAVLGLLASLAIPRVPAAAPNLEFNWNFIAESGRVLKLTGKQRAVFNSILGISWFWFFGGVVTAQLPNYTRLYLGGGASVEILVLALFSIGVGIGSLLCERLSGHKVEIGLVPLGALGMTVFGILLYFARHAPPGYSEIDWRAFLGMPGNGWIALDLTLIGLFAGFFIVPLFALVQSRTPQGELSRVIAGNNIINAVFLVVAAVFAFGMLAAGLTIPQLFLVTALLNAAVTLWIFLLVPEFLMRFVDWLLISVLYRVRATGLEKIPEGPALLVCNHVSFMDALIIMGSVRRPVRFVMYHKIFRVPVLSFVFRAAKAIPIAGAREDPGLLARAFEAIDAALAEGELVCIFPEGGLTPDGEIAPFRSGVEKVLARRPVPVIPLALRGLWRSMWSRRDSKLGRARLPRRFRARIELAAGLPLDGAASNRQQMENAVRALRGAEA